MKVLITDVRWKHRRTHKSQVVWLDKDNPSCTVKLRTRSPLNKCNPGDKEPASPKEVQEQRVKRCCPTCK